MARDGQRDEPGDVAQLRAELAMLRSQLQVQQEREALTEAEKARHAVFLDWVSKSAQERTQLAADKKFPGPGGQLWEVSLPEHPKVTLRASSRYDAEGRYNEVCGIIQTDKEYVIQEVGAAGSA